MFLLRRIAVLSLLVVLLVVWLENVTGPAAESGSVFGAALLWGARGLAVLAIGWAILTIRGGSSSARALSVGAPRPTSFSPDDEGI